MLSPSLVRRVLLAICLLVAIGGTSGALLLPSLNMNTAIGPLSASSAFAEPKTVPPAKKAKADDALAVSAESHPLDPALAIARERLKDIEKNLTDYEATLTTRERIGNKLSDPKTMFVRIREQKEQDGKIVTPLSVYLRFTAPGSVQGQEALWVESQNNNKLLGHQGGTLGRFTPAIWLDPKGPIAMQGSRYPISEIGITNLVTKLIEKGERDRKRDEVEVRFDEKAKVAGRPATLIEVKHPKPRPYFDFYIARIYIDQELKLPVRYAAYSWPQDGGQEPQLLEEYTYTNVKPNVGLTDKDFNEYNKAYGFH
jgi:hypothetical protein